MKIAFELAVRLRTLINHFFPKAIDDVILWERDGQNLVFALRGFPWELYRRFSSRFPIPQRQHEVEHLFAKAMGVDQQVDTDRGHMLVDPQFGSSGEIYFQAFAEMIEGMIDSHLWAHKKYSSLTVLPYPGEPLDDDALPIPYFSARKMKMVDPPRRRPSWAIPCQAPCYVDESEGKWHRWSVDVCLIARTSPGFVGQGRFGTLSVGSGRNERILLLAHSISQKELLDRSFIDRMSRCGGFLYPSLSLGTFPATNFGEVVLVFDPRLVRDSIGSSERGILAREVPPDLSLYDTDAYTVDRAALAGRYGQTMYRELSGNRLNLTQLEDRQIYALGPMLVEGTGATGAVEADPVFTAKKIAQVALDKDRYWQRIMTAKDPDELIASAVSSSYYHYSYLEAKASTVVTPANIVAIVAPNRTAEIVGEALAPHGFQGLALGIPMSAEQEHPISSNQGPCNGKDTQARLRYGLAVRDLVASELPILRLR